MQFDPPICHVPHFPEIPVKLSNLKITPKLGILVG